jgi:hypothetical protein
MAVAHLLHLIRDDVVACDMRNIPGTPDETTDEEQRICHISGLEAKIGG